jgi:CheY-like chemotaxis protein/anti-sigma regulatory factor (Ser/Thr protein kinase)
MQQTHRLKVEVQADAAAEPNAEDIRVLLFQSVRELLFNVVKHAGVASARVRMSRDGDDSVRITVSDEGVGFDPMAPSDEGALSSGFGLFSLRERLDLLGGRIGVESTPDRGTRVTLLAPVRLPEPADREVAAAVPAPAARRKAPTTTTRPRPADGRRRIRVLLADDQKVMRDGLTALLEHEGDIEVVGEADNGRAAVELAQEIRPDVVIMDVNMPVMNGIEATRRILADNPDARVIALSMYEQDEMATRMRQAGAATYLTKGGSAAMLVTAIRAVSKGDAQPRA